MMMAKLAAAVALVFANTHGARMTRPARSEAGAHRGAKGESVAGGPNASIINGRPASECEWIWQVSLEDSIGHFCGGMLIDSRWVLTAAHCLGGTFHVRAGTLRTGSGGQRIRVSQSIPHPSYNSNTMNFDIALLRLEAPMQMNSCVGTVCLPQRDVAPGTTCWITGWGSTSSGGNIVRDLQEVQVETMTHRQCTAGGYSNSEIKPSMLCAQGRNSQGITDACQGDSGGPLVCQSGGVWQIYGATSWGYGCAEAIHPGVWARVHYVLSWIEGHVGSSPSPSPSPSPPRRRSSSGRCPSGSTGPHPTYGDCECNSGKECWHPSLSQCPYNSTEGNAYNLFWPSCGECYCD